MSKGRLGTGAESAAGGIEPAAVTPPAGRPGRPTDEPMGAIRTVWRNVWVRAFTQVVVVFVILATLWNLRHGYAFALQVGVLGFLLAYVLHPFVRLLARVRIGRGLAVLITYVLLLLMLAFGSVVVSQVVTETGRFVQLIPSAIDSVGTWYSDVQERVVGWSERLPDFLADRVGAPEDGTESEMGVAIRTQIQSALQKLVAGIQVLLQNLITGGPGMLVTGATAVISTTFQIFLILLAGAYFLYDFPRIVASFKRFVPLRHRAVADDLLAKADLAVGGYLRGQLLISAMLGVMVWLGLTLIGVPLATAISFLAAVFNLVPYLGPILGTVPAVLLGFTVSPLAAVLALCVFILANQLEAHLLSPFILSRSTNLHPVTVMIAIMAGLGVMGLLGALLAVPVVALSKVILEDYVLNRPPFVPAPVPEAAAEAALAPGAGDAGPSEPAGPAGPGSAGPR